MWIPNRDLKAALFWLGLLPLLILLFDIVFGRLGSNPVQAMHIRLGDWALRFLCVTLAVTPVQAISKRRGMSEYRQLFGLYSFFYATLHVLAYLWIDFQGQWLLIATDMLESSYLWLGLITYIILLLLAISSPDAAKKHMGANWKKLHRFIYLAAVTAVLHYLWQLKGNLAEPMFYVTLIALLLLFRVVNRIKNRRLSKLMIPVGRRRNQFED